MGKKWLFFLIKTIINCQLINVDEEEQQLNVQTSDENVKTEVTLYLYGKVEVPVVNFQPNELHFGDVNVGDVIKKKIEIENPSELLSLTLSYVFRPWIRCEPRNIFLKPKEKANVNVIVKMEYNCKLISTY